MTEPDETNDSYLEISSENESLEEETSSFRKDYTIMNYVTMQELEEKALERERRKIVGQPKKSKVLRKIDIQTQKSRSDLYSITTIPHNQRRDRVSRIDLLDINSNNEFEEKIELGLESERETNNEDTQTIESPITNDSKENSTNVVYIQGATAIDNESDKVIEGIVKKSWIEQRRTKGMIVFCLIISSLSIGWMSRPFTHVGYSTLRPTMHPSFKPSITNQPTSQPSSQSDDWGVLSSMLRPNDPRSGEENDCSQQQQNPLMCRIITFCANGSM